MPEEKIFSYFFTNPGNEDLLKKEIELKLPELHLGPSTKGFVSYVSKTKVQEEERSQILFSRQSGESFSSISTLNLAQGLSKLTLTLPALKHIFYYPLKFHLGPEDLSTLQKSFEELPLQTQSNFQLTLTHAHQNALIPCLSKMKSSSFETTGEIIPSELPSLSPSRSYLKLLEMVKAFKLNFQSDDIFLDVGCAPGGMSYYLLTRGHSVWGIDSGNVSENVTAFGEKFYFIKKSVFEVRSFPQDFKGNWLVGDLNLAPHVSLKEYLRLFDLMGEKKKGMLLTLKAKGPETLHQVFKTEKEIRKLYPKAHFIQVPSHGREFGVYIRP